MGTRGWSPPTKEYPLGSVGDSIPPPMMSEAQSSLPAHLGESSALTRDILQRVFKEPLEGPGFTYEEADCMCVDVGVTTKKEAAQYQKLGGWCLDYIYEGYVEGWSEVCAYSQ